MVCPQRCGGPGRNRCKHTKYIKYAKLVCVVNVVAFPAANVVNAKRTSNMLELGDGMVNNFPQGLDAVVFEVH